MFFLCFVPPLARNFDSVAKISVQQRNLIRVLTPGSAQSFITLMASILTWALC